MSKPTPSPVILHSDGKDTVLEPYGQSVGKCKGNYEQAKYNCLLNIQSSVKSFLKI